MNELKILKNRIKYARLYKPEKGGERLYIRYGKNRSGVRTSAWFEIVNDRITPFVRVEDNKHPNYYDDNLATRYKLDIRKQFYEIINDCELERKKFPLHERLKDDVIPVHEGSLMHQAQALRFCCTMKVSALFGDTGVAKTKVAIDLSVSRYEAGRIKKVLIFCPVSTKRNFWDEIDRWYHGDGVEWKIVGLETMSSSETTVLETIDWVDNDTFIIIDESHNCKTPFAKRSKRIKACCEKCSYKLIMTGTPAESVKDMYMQYAMLSDLIIGEPNWLRFEEKYLIMGGPARDEVIGYKNVNHLMGMLEPYTYQIRKEDCMNLPDKTFHRIKSEMNTAQHEKYEEIKQELMDRIDYYEDEPVPVYLIFQYLTKLQQISCGFHRHGSDIEELGSRKFEELERLDYRNGQTIFFCKYLFEVDKLLLYLGRENCAVFIGENRQVRDHEKDLFTRREKQFFVATMGSGGTGLNGLQYCSRIMFWSNSFKWIQRKQCVGRIDRQGQTNKMSIFDMICDCGIDHRIMQNLARKGDLADEIRQLLHHKTKLKQYVECL